MWLSGGHVVEVSDDLARLDKRGDALLDGGNHNALGVGQSGAAGCHEPGDGARRWNTDQAFSIRSLRPASSRCPFGDDPQRSSEPP